MPGIPALAVLSVLGFTGYAVLLPVVPLWVVGAGAGTAGAGLVNGVMLTATVATQGLIPMALRRAGWAWVLAVGLVLLGMPALVLGVSSALPWVLAWSAVRGVGFGVLTVCGSSAVAQLVEPERRGAGIGAYGLAVAVPNVFALALAPWLAQRMGFLPVFVLAAAPVLGVWPAVRLARRIQARQATTRASEYPVTDLPHLTDAQAWRPLTSPTLLLLSVTLAGGALITFLPQMVPGPRAVTAALLIFGVATAFGRWAAGGPADRYGAGRFTAPLLACAVVGLVLVAWAVGAHATHEGSAVPGSALARLMTGMLLAGIAYGALQNLTLVLAFAAVPHERADTASAVWNVGFDAGTAVGSVLLGLLATRMDFSTGTLVVAAICAAALPLTWQGRPAGPRRAPR